MSEQGWNVSTVLLPGAVLLWEQSEEADTVGVRGARGCSLKGCHRHALAAALAAHIFSRGWSKDLLCQVPFEVLEAAFFCSTVYTVV